MPTSTPQPVLEIHSGIMLKGRLSMVKDVVLTGEFDGELETLGCLTVAAGGVAKGTIDAGALILEPGNLVEARIKIGPKVKPKPGLGAPAETKETTGGFWSGRFEQLKAVFSRK